MAKTHRAQIDAENDHRRVTRPRLRIIVKETRGYPTGYLRASSDAIEHGPESRDVGYDEAKTSMRLMVIRPNKRIQKMLRRIHHVTLFRIRRSLHLIIR